MSRVLTFSRTFPAYHPKAGHPTFFIEKLWAGMPPFDFKDREHDYYAEMYRDVVGQNWDGYEEMIGRVRVGITTPFPPKLHTIRSGNRWEPGDKFSPRVWSGRPYNSPQIAFAPDVEVKKVWHFEILRDWIWIEGQPKSRTGDLKEIANNDGLSIVDFFDWFRYPAPFDGQIIAWSENVNY